jgi:sugar/nucleoside kinase (ribokinase family)
VTARRFDVVGIGESSIDYVYRVPRLPRAGGPAKLRIARADVSPGGQVATTLAACAALGLRAAYVGAIGADGNGRLIREALEQRGIDTGSLIVRGGASRYAVILVEESSGERVVLWHRDPAVVLRPADVRPEILRAARLVHVDAVDESAAIHAAVAAREAGVPVTSDIDQVTDGTRALVAAVTIPILADGVPQALTGESSPEAALRALRRNHNGLLCVTRGALGAMLLDGDTLHEVPAGDVEAVDTTGAGDVFRGAFIYALLRGDAPREVLRFANAAAAVSCTREGAMAGVPRLEEIGA